MQQKDRVVLGLGVLGGLLLLARRGGSPRMVVTVDYDAGEASQKFTPYKPAAKPAPTPSDPNTPTNPPPIPDVDNQPSKPTYQRIQIPAAVAMMRAMGADEDDLPDTGGTWDQVIGEAWARAANVLRSPGDYAFERASNTTAWVDPLTARGIEAAAKAKRQVFTEPPPLPDVETPSPRAALTSKVQISTVVAVLKKLGADELPETGGTFDPRIAQAWRDAAYAIKAPGDFTLARASNTEGWCDPKTVAAIAATANAGRKVLPLPEGDSSEDADESAVLQNDNTQAANQVTRDALDAAAKAARAAASGNLGVQKPVPELPLALPNPPPPKPVNLERARVSAPKVDANIKAKRDKYDRTMLAKFQADAGLVDDGLYGPVSQSALKYFGVRDPARPIFRNKNFTTYTPPATAG